MNPVDEILNEPKKNFRVKSSRSTVLVTGTCKQASKYSIKILKASDGSWIRYDV